MSVPEQPAPSRPHPVQFVGEVLSELRAASWPSWRTLLSTSGVVVLSLLVVMVLVAVTDLVSISVVSRVMTSVQGLEVPGWLSLVLVGLQVVTLVAVSVLSLKGPAPAGGLAGVFGGGASESASGQTPSERRLFRLTTLAAVAFVFVTFDLALLG